MISTRLMAMLASALFAADRVTKLIALRNCYVSRAITSWLACDTSLNRGVSWSIAVFEDTPRYVAVSLLVGLLILWCCWYTYQRWKVKQSIAGLLLVLTGAISNLLDRALYGGVVDFIVLHYHGWCFPTFNIADVLICVGVGLSVWHEALYE